MASEAKIFEICKLLLVFAGLWEIPNSSKFYKIFSFGCQGMFATCLPFFAMDIIINWKDVEAVMSSVKCITFVGVIMGKLFIVQSEKVRKVIKQIVHEETVMLAINEPEIPLIYEKQARYCKKITSFVVLFMCLCSASFIGDATYRSVDFYNRHPNATMTTEEKPLPIEWWFPYKNDYYKTALFFQFLHITQATIYNVSVQPLVLSVMIFLKAKLKILQYRVRNIEPFADQMAKPVNVLKHFIREHQKLIRLHGEFNASFQYIVLMEYCATSLTLAFIFIELLQRQRILFHLLFAGYVSSQLFTLAWSANEILLESSVGLAYALYESPWYRMDETSKLLIQIMLMRCKKPLTIFIGPFGYMDLDAALSRMKLAYSVVSVFSTN